MWLAAFLKKKMTFAIGFMRNGAGFFFSAGRLSSRGAQCPSVFWLRIFGFFCAWPSVLQWTVRGKRTSDL